MLRGLSFHRLFSSLSTFLVLFSEFNIATRSRKADFTALPGRVKWREDVREEEKGSAFGAPSESTSCEKTTGLDSPSDAKYPSTRLFSAEQHHAFERDGFLVVSDLLDAEMLQDIVTAGDNFLDQTNKMESYFASIEMGMIFQAGSHVNRTVTRPFRKVALESRLPDAAAELMRLEPTESIRVLRDVFMSKDINIDETCDWHVDDVGFWPEAFDSEKEGINAWIALDDMPREFQGSMALSPGSHKAEWRHDAYAAIGLNLTFQGGFTKEEVTQMAKDGAKLLTTCEMKTQAPDLREKIEATKFVPDIRKGDVIFATRSAFHRTIPATLLGKRHYQEGGIRYLNRYSVRYVPGAARLPHGWTFEWSIKNNPDNSGLDLDSAMEERTNLLWYPKVWPSLDPQIHQRLDLLAGSVLEEMKAQTKRDLYELFALFFPSNEEQSHHNN